MTAVIGDAVARAPGRQHRAEHLADARDHDQRQRHAGHTEAALKDERDDDHDDPDQPGAERHPGDRHQ
jgi:hypothetical protein